MRSLIKTGKRFGLARLAVFGDVCGIGRNSIERVADLDEQGGLYSSSENRWIAMSGGLKTTFKLLSATKNETASDLLLETLSSDRSEIKFSGLSAITRRRSPRLHNQLLSRWHNFSERAKATLVASSTRITQAVRDAILSQNDQLGANGCDAALRMTEYDLIPVLVTAAEDQNNPNRERAARAILSLAESLNDEMTTPRDYRNRRDPRVIRRFVVGALEVSINRFEQHQKREIVEAFLILTTCENSALAGILRHTDSKVFQTATKLLASSPRLGVIRLLLNFLDTVYVPQSDLGSARHLLPAVLPQEGQ